MRSTDLNLFMVFEALLAERSVTRAAKRIGLSQPAVSEALARLRILLGDELFVRSPAGMVATQRALEVAPQVRSGLAALRAAVQEGQQFDASTARRTYRFAATDYAEVVLVSPLAGHLRRSAPGIAVRMVSADSLGAIGLLDRGLADFAIGVFAKSLPKRFERATLMRERAICLSRKQHPVLKGSKLTLKHYLALPHVVGSLTGDVNPALVDRRLAEIGKRRTIGMTVTSSLSLPFVLAQTDFIATQPARMAHILAGIGGLDLHEVPITLAGWEVELVWGRGIAADPAAMWLRACLQAVCSGL